MQKTLDKLAKQGAADVEMPADLVEKVKAGLADDEAESWDTIIFALQVVSESEPPSEPTMMVSALDGKRQPLRRPLAVGKGQRPIDRGERGVRAVPDRAETERTP